MDNSTASVKRVDRTIWLFGLGYFIAYTPYAGLVKAMSAGKLPGLAGIEGLTLLPSVLAGTIVTLPIFVLLLGWWRYAHVPIAVGYGISRPEHVRALHGVADGVVVGSAIVDAAERGTAAVSSLVRSLREATG